MSALRTLVNREGLKSPVAILFALVYLLAAGLAFRSAPLQALSYLGMSLGILLLVWLIIGLTKKLSVEEIQIRKPAVELTFALVVFLVFIYGHFPRVDFGEKWYLSSILRKELVLFILPFVFLRLRDYDLPSLGFSFRHWKQNLKIGGIVLACMAIPGVLWVSNTASLILGGQLTAVQVVAGFFILLVHNVLLSGLPEEFFFRSVVQTRLSFLLKSKLSGILLTSLLFGLLHIDDLMRWYPGMALSDAFCRAFFIQSFLGIVLGTLWARTRSLLPSILVHSGLNALNNLGSVPSLLLV